MPSIHALVLVKVDQLVIYLERVNLVEGFHIEPRSRHLPIVPGISYYVVIRELTSLWYIVIHGIDYRDGR